MSARAEMAPIRVLALPAYNRRQQNPFTALLYDAVRAEGVEVADWTWPRALWRSCDIWHLHHPDTVLFPRRLWQSAGETFSMRLLLTWARLRGIKVVWTVHDLGSHDGLHPLLEKWFWRYFPPRVDAIVALTAAGRDAARARWPALARTPARVIPHGSFREVYPNTVGKAEARARLGLDPARPVILHFGLVRRYKSVPELVEAFRALPRTEATLLVAGKVWDEALEGEIRARARDHVGIDLRFGWIPFEQTQLYFKAADLVVLPYRRILNSGAALLALGFDRPILVPAAGAMPELAERFGGRWVRLFEGEISAPGLRSALDWALECRAGGVDWDGLDWPTLARRHLHLYTELLNRRPRASPVPT